jgi:hypothetical protein
MVCLNLSISNLSSDSMIDWFSIIWRANKRPGALLGQAIAEEVVDILGQER